MIKPIFINDIYNKKNFIVDIKNPRPLVYHNIFWAKFKCSGNCLGCKQKLKKDYAILLDVMLFNFKNGNWYTDKEKVLWLNKVQYEQLLKNNKFIYTVNNLEVSDYTIKKLFFSLPHNKDQKIREMNSTEKLNRIILTQLKND